MKNNKSLPENEKQKFVEYRKQHYKMKGKCLIKIIRNYFHLENIQLFQIVISQKSLLVKNWLMLNINMFLRNEFWSYKLKHKMSKNIKIFESIYKNRYKIYKYNPKGWVRQKRVENYKLKKILKTFKTIYENR